MRGKAGRQDAVSDDAPGPLAPGLYVVATPIGNLDDVTLRALAVLRGVDLVLAEDTRRTRKLLTHFDIKVRLKSLHAHNETAQCEGLASRMAAGERMALVSDAGTPLLSDPGHALVAACLAAGVAVVPIPGASSLLAALVGAGLAIDRFTFVGYPPRRQAARRALLRDLAGEAGTLVFLESPRRVAALLTDAAAELGDRQVAVARELTKVHEEFIRGTLPDVADRLAGGVVRGEVTVCIAGRDAAPPGPATSQPEHDALARGLAEMLHHGTPRNEALKALARRFGVTRRAVYQALLVQEEEDR